MNPALIRVEEAAPFRFERLPFYTREEALLSTWYAQAFGSARDWQAWAGEVFGELLRASATTEMRLVVKHTIERDQQDAVYTLNGGVTIGRGPENDIMLPAQSVTKQHARLIFNHGVISLEDLGSTLGTYVANQKLGPHKPTALAAGAAFTIFPYVLTVEQRDDPLVEASAAISEARSRAMTWTEFVAESAEGFLRFPVEVHPAEMAGALEASVSFLQEAVARLLGESVSAGPLAGLQPSDRGLLSFLLLAVLERANRELRFPFQFLLKRPLDSPRIAPDERGIGCAFSVEWSDLRGVFRLFLPVSLLRGMQEAWPAAEKGRGGFERVAWRLSVCPGQPELSAEEAASLEAGDIVLLTREALLVLPGGNRGWIANLAADCSSVTIERCFERRVLMEDEMVAASGNQNPDLSGLPVQLHVVLGHKELTLAELQALGKGAILELERGTSGAVELALNGKPAGNGELVEIEGKLGVRILGWNAC